MISQISQDQSSPLDPDIYDWLTSARQSQLETRFTHLVDILHWSKLLKPVLTSWVRRELIYESAAYEENHQVLDDPEQVEKILMEWSSNNWSHRLESIYLDNKSNLDQVSCSLLRVKNQNLAFELYHRLKSREATFEELSWNYGEGDERNHGGRFNKKRLRAISPSLHPLLMKLRPGEVLKPHRIADWFVILSLEELSPSQFDERTKSFLLKCELNDWIKAVVSHLVVVLGSGNTSGSTLTE